MSLPMQEGSPTSTLQYSAETIVSAAHVQHLSTFLITCAVFWLQPQQIKHPVLSGVTPSQGNTHSCTKKSSKPPQGFPAPQLFSPQEAPPLLFGRAAAVPFPRPSACLQAPSGDLQCRGHQSSSEQQVGPLLPQVPSTTPAVSLSP